jgi:hypothetical protein
MDFRQWTKIVCLFWEYSIEYELFIHYLLLVCVFHKEREELGNKTDLREGWKRSSFLVPSFWTGIKKAGVDSPTPFCNISSF